MGEGYLAVAGLVAGDAEAPARFDAAVAAFERMAEDAEKRDDAEFGLEQIRLVRRRYAAAE